MPFAAAGQHVSTGAESHRINAAGASSQGRGQGSVFTVQQAGGEILCRLQAVGGEGELRRESCVAGAELKGFGDYLVIDRLVTLPDRCRALIEGEGRGRHCQYGQQREHGETGPPPAAAAG